MGTRWSSAGRSRPIHCRSPTPSNSNSFLLSPALSIHLSLELFILTTLSKMISAKSKEIVKATAPVVGAHALEITKTFYKTMFANNPEVLSFFNPANQVSGRQPAALANAVVAYATNLDHLERLGHAVDVIAHKHCALNVLPEHYSIVGTNLIAAVGEVLGDAVTTEVADAWTEAYGLLANICINREEELYQAAESRPGGWRGTRPFVVSRKQQVADRISQFTFVPEDGSTGVIEFTPGQFTTVHLSASPGGPQEYGGVRVTPRHYSITSEQPGAELSIGVKHITDPVDGVVSSYLSSHTKEGDVIMLSPPFGPFGPLGTDISRPAVLVSGGVGVTPMLPLLNHFKNEGRQVFMIHSDDHESAHGFRENLVKTIESSDKVSAKFVYNHENPTPTRVLPEGMAVRGWLDQELLGSLMSDASVPVDQADVYMCGPPGMMKDMHTHFKTLGVTDEHITADWFGPQGTLNE